MLSIPRPVPPVIEGIKVAAAEGSPSLVRIVSARQDAAKYRPQYRD